jgi:molybdate transport system substrate-binding protein
MLGRCRLVAALSVALVLAACGNDNAASSSITTSPSPLTGTLSVFAAASLTEAFSDEQAALVHRHPGLHRTYNFAGSQALVQQITQGASADVFASADEKNMQKLVDAGLVETPRVFARNKLEILVASGNPKHITGLGDLARSDLIVVLADPSVPAGAYSQRALSKAGVAAKPKSLELDVKAAAAKVISGEADAAIVYVTDVTAAATRATGVPIPDEQNAIATYPIAVVRAAKNHAAAVAFVAELLSGSGQRVLTARGFLPASA